MQRHPAATPTRLRFDGWIAGLGTASGTRIVVGHWVRSPFGPVSDVMLESPVGERLLLASSEEFAVFVAATYVFDRIEVTPVAVSVRGNAWTVTAGPLDLSFTVGRRGVLGFLLRAGPPRKVAKEIHDLLGPPGCRSAARNSPTVRPQGLPRRSTISLAHQVAAHGKDRTDPVRVERVRESRTSRLNEGLVDEAPTPILTRFEGPHQRVLGCREVGGGMPFRRGIAAADVAAAEAFPQVHPAAAFRDAVRTALDAVRLNIADGIEMRTSS